MEHGRGSFTGGFVKKISIEHQVQNFLLEIFSFSRSDDLSEVQGSRPMIPGAHVFLVLPSCDEGPTRRPRALKGGGARDSLELFV